jgi:hypothetical protein
MQFPFFIGPNITRSYMLGLMAMLGKQAALCLLVLPLASGALQAC